jgi:hypothetical protein
VGKRAWRKIEEQMSGRTRIQPPDGFVIAEVVRDRKLGNNQSGLYKIFSRRKELQIELDITRGEAVKLQKILDRTDPARLREVIRQEAPELADAFEVVMKKAATLPLPAEPPDYPYPEPLPHPLGDPGPQVNTTERPGSWITKVGGCMIEFPKGLFEVEDIVMFENGLRGLPAAFHVDRMRDLVQSIADEITDNCGTSPVTVVWKKKGLLTVEELPAPEPEYNEDPDDIPF